MRIIRNTILLLGVVITLHYCGGGFGYNEIADAGIDDSTLRIHGGKIAIAIGIILTCLSVWVLPPKEWNDSDFKYVGVGVVVIAILAWIAC